MILDCNRFVYNYPWFAWFPVYLQDSEKWAWLRWVRKEIDERPLHYLSLLESVRYYELEEI